MRTFKKIAFGSFSFIFLFLLFPNADVLFAQGQVINDPNSSTVCTQQQNCRISWYIYAGNDDIRIEYQLSGASSWTTIVDLNNVNQSDYYDWNIPSNLSAGSYRVRIGQSQSGGLYYAYWTESPYFQINEAPYLDVVQPISGNYITGTEVNVQVNTNLSSYTLHLEDIDSGTLTSLSLNGNDQWVIESWATTGEFRIVAEETGGGLISQSDIVSVSNPEGGVFNLNYVRTKTARVPADTETAFDLLDSSTGNITDQINYVDGVGKIRQSISLNSTVAGDHIVNPISYDEIGFQTTSFLPYPTSEGSTEFKESAIEAQQRFFDNPSSNVTVNTHPFAVTVYKKSPLLTIKEQGATGANWQPGQYSIKTENRLNTVSDNVIRWEIDTDINANGLKDSNEQEPMVGNPIGKGFYAANELTVITTTDEIDNLYEVYVDRLGRKVLKVGYKDVNTPVRTYYVYDRFGNLRFIIPPEASEEIGNNSTWTSIGTLQERYMTEMRYDGYGRLVEKKIPEAEWIYTVYDNLGRVILTQDGNMRQNGDWFFSKYDIRGRTIVTGVYTENDISLDTREEMQAKVYTETTYWEKRDGTDFETNHGYTNNLAFPKGGTEAGVQLWSVTYHDDYDFDSNGTPDESFIKHADFDPPTGNNLVDYEVDLSRTDGLVTGNKTRILNQWKVVEENIVEYDAHNFENDEVYYIGVDENYSITLKPGFETNPGQKVVIGGPDVVPIEVFDDFDKGNWLEGVSFYDKYGNSIYTKSTNHVGGMDENWTLYTFDGLVAESRTKHVSSTETVNISQDYNYDTQGRLIEEYHNGKLVKKLTYNELGQVIKKELDDFNGSSFVQTLDYTYHERGWLESVNDRYHLNDDLFAYTLSYNPNGNVSVQEWNSELTYRQRYTYTHDGLNQVIKADYISFIGGNSSSDNGYGTEYSYDLNGNITTLKRRSSGTLIDDLSYSYHGNMISLLDDNIAPTVAGGFVELSEYEPEDPCIPPLGGEPADCIPFPQLRVAEYTYDYNGNMNRDANKGIESIRYNYMNLPELVTFDDGNKLSFFYDATGNKLSKTTHPTSGVGVTTDYSGGFVYEDNDLNFYTFSEGRVRNTTYEYDLKDHLGNVRSTFTVYHGGNPLVLQEDNYYPFGLKIPGLSYVASGSDENKFTYNGKELEDEFGLDWYHYGWRFYDATVARWWVVDPIDEFISPYNYVGNNPIMLTDPNGANSDCPTCLLDNLYALYQLYLNFQANSWYNEVGAKFGFLPPPPPPIILERATMDNPPPLVSNLDAIQIGLDLVGVTEIPIVSSLAEVASAGIDLYHGDYLSAGLGLGSAIPIVGKTFEIAKFTRKGYKNFRKHSKNTRRNLELYTGESGIGKDAHHIFPQKFRSIFQEKGIIIDSPVNMAWWSLRKGHRRAAKEYNQYWEDFLLTDPKTQEILDYGDELMKAMKQKYDF